MNKVIITAKELLKKSKEELYNYFKHSFTINLIATGINLNRVSITGIRCADEFVDLNYYNINSKSNYEEYLKTHKLIKKSGSLYTKIIARDKPSSLDFLINPEKVILSSPYKTIVVIFDEDGKVEKIDVYNSVYDKC